MPIRVLLHWLGNVYRHAGFHNSHENNGDYGRGRRETLARREVEFGRLDGTYLDFDLPRLRPSGLGVYAFVPAYFVGQQCASPCLRACFRFGKVLFSLVFEFIARLVVAAFCSMAARIQRGGA